MSSTTKGKKTMETMKEDNHEQSPKKQRKKSKEPTSIIKENNKYSKNKKKAVWSKNYVEYINVQSFKKYNLENCHEEPTAVKDKTRCNCIIF